MNQFETPTGYICNPEKRDPVSPDPATIRYCPDDARSFYDEPSSALDPDNIFMSAMLLIEQPTIHPADELETAELLIQQAKERRIDIDYADLGINELGEPLLMPLQREPRRDKRTARRIKRGPGHHRLSTVASGIVLSNMVQ